MAKYTPTSTQYYADDHVHSVSVNSSGHWELWKNVEKIKQDDSLPNRKFEDGMTAAEQKVIGYRVLRDNGFTPIRMTGDKRD